MWDPAEQSECEILLRDGSFNEFDPQVNGPRVCTAWSTRPN
jgi:hypothetical protein